MAIFGQWFVLLHIVSAFALIAGFVGREASRAYARRQEKLEIFVQFLGLSGWFESKLVIPGSTAVLLFGLMAAWTHGWPIFGVLQGSPMNWLFVSLLLYLSLIPVIVFIFLPRGKIFEQKLADAKVQARITPELRASMEDAVVRLFHIYEAVVVAVILYLMIMKPF